MTSFESSLIKYTRAKKQFEALSADLIILSDFKSYTINKDIDDLTGNQIYSFVEVPPLPDDLCVRIGEMLYNFRCSLDHIVWQLVESGRSIPTFRNEFPIFNDSIKYERDKRSKLKGVPSELIPLIDSLQPCNSTGQTDYWWYLWYLHRLGNADKHRHLLLTRRTLAKNIRINWAGTNTKLPKGRYYNTPVEDGAIFLCIESGMDVKINPTIKILFNNAPSDIRSDLTVDNIIGLIHNSVYKVLSDFQII